MYSRKAHVSYNKYRGQDYKVFEYLIDIFQTLMTVLLNTIEPCLYNVFKMDALEVLHYIDTAEEWLWFFL